MASASKGWLKYSVGLGATGDRSGALLSGTQSASAT